ncbi:acetylglucosamine transferase, partial [Neisseria gonorrhoeae]
MNPARKKPSLLFSSAAQAASEDG